MELVYSKVLKDTMNEKESLLNTISSLQSEKESLMRLLRDLRCELDETASAYEQAKQEAASAEERVKHAITSEKKAYSKLSDHKSALAIILTLLLLVPL
jgi:predicted  nucleic acid-binding Zn-ribbon protein